MNFIAIFIISNVINVTLSTIKSIVTVKGGKVSAACINALTYGFYTVIIYLTAQDNDGLSLLAKSLIIGSVNLVCVFLVKLVEEKKTREKLWKIELTVPTEHTMKIDTILEDIPHSYIKLSDKHTLFNFYCATQKESVEVKKIVDHYGAKYFVAESKTL